MKKIALFLAVIMCFAALPAYAEVSTKTYNTNLTIVDGVVTGNGSDTVTVDLARYELVATGTFDEQENLTLTKPGFAIAYIGFRNEDQKPGVSIPIPISMNYECTLVQQRYEADGVTKVDEYKAKDIPRVWCDGGYPTVVAGGGDYEWSYLQVTQEMIAAAGGAFDVTFLVRAPMYQDASVSDLGQVYSGDFIHVYQEKNSIANQDVIGSFVPSEQAATVYNVDIIWGAMQFNYTDNQKGDWNPQTHSYDTVTTGAWTSEENANAITVCNNSNAAVNISLSYTASADFADVTAEFALADGSTVSTLQLDSADNGLGLNGAGSATEQTCYLQITGGALTVEDVDVIIGTVCLTLN